MDQCKRPVGRPPLESGSKRIAITLRNSDITYLDTKSNKSKTIRDAIELYRGVDEGLVKVTVDYRSFLRYINGPSEEIKKYEETLKGLKQRYAKLEKILTEIENKEH